MRILRLDLSDGEELDLHPYVTSLGGFAPGDRRRVVDRLLRIARGDASGGPGLIEVAGDLSEVDATVLAGLSLDPAVDCVVRAEQLPGATVAANSGRGELAQRSADARDALARVETELSSAREAVAAANKALDDARRGLDDYAITAHDASLAAVRAAEDAARARLGASPAVDQRAQLVAALEAARAEAAAHDAELETERVALLELLEALEAERQRLDELTARRDAGHSASDEPAPVPSADDVAAVQRALATVRAGAPPAARVPSPQAIDLADRIAAHDQRHDELEAALRAEGVDVIGLQDRLANAQMDARDAEEASRPKVISPADDAEIERLHDIVVEQSEKKNSRRGGKGAERAYEEATEALDELLDRVGYPTYAAYVMGRISPSVDPEAKRRHEDAVARVAEIEAQLDEAASVLERDSRVLMLRAERDQLWAEARDTLGTLPDDVEGALRAMRVDAPVEFTAVDDLQTVLDSVGAISPSSDEVTVVAIAETYLADAAIARAAAETTRSGNDIDPLELEIRETKRRLADLHTKATEGDATLAEWEAESERLGRLATAAEAALADHDASATSPEDADEARIASDPAVSAAREQASMTAARLARHRAAVEQVDDRHADLRAARSVEREVEARRDAASGAVDAGDAVGALDDDDPDPEVVWSLDGGDVEPLEWYLFGRVTALREVGEAGSVPLILDDAFRGLPEAAARALCAALARVGQSTQVVYVGDAPAVAAWAAEQGLDHAAVVRPGQPAI
jgi:hypothetical protein